MTLISDLVNGFVEFYREKTHMSLRGRQPETILVQLGKIGIQNDLRLITAKIAGINELGKKIIREMNTLGMVINIAHASNDAARRQRSRTASLPNYLQT